MNAKTDRARLAKKLRDRVGRFVFPSRAQRASVIVRRYHERVSEVLQTISHLNGNIYLVGGTLRDLLLAPSRFKGLYAAPRDLDIVVDGVTSSDLLRAFAGLIQRRTRFGGLHLALALPSGWQLLFDIWPLQETWAFQEFTIPVEIDRFPETPFLNLDAAAVELTRPPVWTPGKLFCNPFLDGVIRRELDVNFLPNPFPAVCIVRALIMAVRLRYSIGLRLAEYMVCESRRLSGDDLLDAQMSHYGSVRVQSTELKQWLASIERQLDERQGAIAITAPPSRQLSLWTDYPDRSFDTSPSYVEVGKEGVYSFSKSMFEKVAT